MILIKSIKTKSLLLLIPIVLATALAWLIAPHLPPAVDLPVFTQAGTELVTGGNPYTVQGYYTPPWTALPFAILALLPPALARSTWLILSIMMFVFTAQRLKGSPLAIGLVMISSPVLLSLRNGNIEALVLLGLVLPRWLGVFLLASKPQIGLGILCYWLFVDRDYKIFIVPSLITLVSFILYGFWPGRANELENIYWNASLWPASLPIGAVLLVASVRQKSQGFAMACSPALSPYLHLSSYAGALLGLVRHVPELAVGVGCLWVINIII